MHKLCYIEGTDARNHIVKCGCGWSFSSTHNAVRERGRFHVAAFDNELRAWSDPQRKTMMPTVSQYWNAS